MPRTAAPESRLAQARVSRVAAEMLQAAAAEPEREGLAARVAGLAPRRPIEVQPASPVHTPRFSLRMLELRDREEFFRVLEVSPHVERFIPLRHPGERPEATFARHLAMARNGDASGLTWRRIAVEPSGRIVGGFNLTNIERGLAFRADATWWVAGDCLRQRIATECVYAMIDLALADAPVGLGLHEVSAHVQTENDPSLRLAARIGLRETSHRPQTLRVGENWLLHRTFAKTVLDRA